MSTRPKESLAELLDRERKAAHLSGREAAKRAGISEGRWRQILAGAVPPARTVVALAIATGADPREAIRAAGLDVRSDVLDEMVSKAREPVDPTLRRPRVSSSLAEEIDRIRSLPLDPDDKIRIANALIQLYEERSNGAKQGQGSAA